MHKEMEKEEGLVGCAGRPTWSQHGGGSMENLRQKKHGVPSSRGKRRVGIIGAGMTGICVCKFMVQQGLEAVVLEAQPGIGGVWRHNFAITRLQTPRDAYQFSDFLWPPGTPDYPSHAHVLEYLESYARKFHVLPCIRFNSKVDAIRQVHHPPTSSSDSGGPSCNWAVHIRRTAPQSAAKELSSNGAEVEEEWLYFDFLVSCIGRYGDVPKLPILPSSNGFETFRGKILHTMDYAMLGARAASELVRSKRVVVIGMMKSALDVAAEIAIANKGARGDHHCTMVFRSPHWMLPHHKPFGLPLSYLYSTRLSEFMIAKPDQGPFLDVISAFLRPVRWAISKFVELYLLLNLPLWKYGLVPKQTFFEQFASCQVPLLPDDFFENVKSGQIQLRRTNDWGFTENGVMLSDGTHIEADVIILGTGYDGEKKLRTLLEDVNDGFPPEPGNIVPLYRGMIPSGIPQMAIMGFYENFSNLHSSEMGARWLSHLLSGKISLPSRAEMERAMEQWIEYMKKSTPFYQKSCIGAVSIWHSDEMCRDIGWNPRRKANFMQELVSPYSNMDYRDG